MMDKPASEVLLEQKVVELERELAELLTIPRTSKERTSVKKRLTTARRKLAVFQPETNEFEVDDLRQDNDDGDIEPPSYVTPGIDIEKLLNKVVEIPTVWQRTYLVQKREEENGMGEYMCIDLLGGSLPVINKSRFDNKLPGRDRIEVKVEHNGHVTAGQHAVDNYNEAMFTVVEPIFRQLVHFVENIKNIENNLDRLGKRAAKNLRHFLTRHTNYVVQRHFSRNHLDALYGAMKTVHSITSSFRLVSPFTQKPEEMHATFLKYVRPMNCFPRYVFLIREDKMALVTLENDVLDNHLSWTARSKQGVAFGVNCFNKSTTVMKIPLPEPRLQSMLIHVDEIKNFRIKRRAELLKTHAQAA
jgi:hypothetical protein